MMKENTSGMNFFDLFNFLPTPRSGSFPINALAEFSLNMRAILPTHEKEVNLSISDQH
jgi:hypothetical protein